MSIAKENGWYKHTNGDHKLWLVYYDFTNIVRYGFNANGDWFQDNNLDYVSSLELATKNEVQAQLIKEADRRGFANTIKIKSLITMETETLSGSYYSFAPYPDYFNFGSRHIFAKGNWAEILPQSESEVKLTLNDVEVDLIDISTYFEDKAIQIFRDNNIEWIINTDFANTYRLLSDRTIAPKTTITYKKFMELFATEEKSFLQQAEEIINGSRSEDYGSVTENFSNIAKGWEIIFEKGITPRKVAHAMTWLKICRDINTEKDDNIIDIAGYAGCIGKMINELNQ